MQIFGKMCNLNLEVCRFVRPEENQVLGIIYIFLSLPFLCFLSFQF